MPSIVSYRKYIDALITRELRLPEDPQTRERLGQELATIDGVTYVSLQTGATLPAEQPQEIAASIAPVTLTPALREAIKAASPICKMISQRMIEKIRSRYSIDDELFLARVGVGKANGLYSPSQEEVIDMAAFGSYVEEVRRWGRGEREKLGL